MHSTACWFGVKLDAVEATFRDIWITPKQYHLRRVRTAGYGISRGATLVLVAVPYVFGPVEPTCDGPQCAYGNITLGFDFREFDGELLKEIHRRCNEKKLNVIGVLEVNEQILQSWEPPYRSPGRSGITIRPDQVVEEAFAKREFPEPSEVPHLRSTFVCLRNKAFPHVQDGTHAVVFPLLLATRANFTCSTQITFTIVATIANETRSH